MVDWRGFLRDESGAVTVDWVVLAASVVGLGVASVTAVRTGVVDLSGEVSTSLSSASVASLGTLGGATAEFAYALRHYSQAEHEAEASWIINNWSDSTLLDSLPSYAQVVSNFINSGNNYHAGMYMDSLYAMHVAVEDRGLTWPDDVPTLAELDAAYSTEFE